MNGYRVVFPEPGKAVLEDYSVPKLNSDEVLIETEFSVISAGTERAHLLDLPNTWGVFPRYPGYSAVGRVIDRGKNAKKPDIGERVIVYFGEGHCTYSVKKAEELIKVPDGVSSEDAAFVVIAGMALQGVRKAKLELGESSMVVGMGLLGLFSVQLCKLSGSIPVIAVDYNQQRLELSKSLGADYIFTPDHESLNDVLKDITNSRGPRAIIEVTGASSALKQALQIVAPQGRVILLGCTRIADDPIDFYRYVHHPGVSIVGAHTFIRPEKDSYPGYWTYNDDHRVLLELIKDGRLKVKPIISEIVCPKDASNIYSRLAKDPCAPLGILFDWKLMMKG